jgi:hypothetical protein
VSCLPASASAQANFLFDEWRIRAGNPRFVVDQQSEALAKGTGTLQERAAENSMI